MPFRRGFKAEANRIALRVREQLSLDAKAPIDPFAVCELYEIPVFKLSEVSPDSPFLRQAQSEFSAVTVPSGFHTAIVHNDSHHPYRQRSNVCHELAHCFLGHECAPPLTDEGTRSRDSGIEAEANFLAGALLIPNEAAIHILLNGNRFEAERIYGVSNDMLTYRLRVSGAQTILKRMGGPRR